MKIRLIIFATILCMLQSCAQKEDLIPELSQKQPKTIVSQDESIDLRDTPTCQAPLNFVDLKESPNFSVTGVIDCDLTNSTVFFLTRPNYDYYELDVSDANGLGRLQIQLPIDAKTGIYTTSTSRWVSSRNIYINARVSFNSGLSALQSQKVFVDVNNSSKTIRIKFCNLLIYTSPNPSGGNHEASLTGDIRGIF